MLEKQRAELLSIIMEIIDNRLEMINHKINAGYDMSWLKEEIQNIKYLQEEAHRLR